MIYVVHAELILRELALLGIFVLQIFRLEPRVGGLDLFVEEPSKEELTKEKKFEKREELGYKYGTKAAKRRVLTLSSTVLTSVYFSAKVQGYLNLQ